MAATVTSCGGGADGGAGPGVPVVALVVVTPGMDTVVVLDHVQLTLTVKDSSGHVLTNHTASWASANSSVATVDGSGAVSGVAMGTATITATVAGVQGQASVTVAPIVVLTPQLPSAFAGDTLQLVATPTNIIGDTLTGGGNAAWSTSNSAVVTVSGGGVVTTVSAGTATISATLAGGMGTTSVAVLTSPAHGNREVSYLADYTRADGSHPVRLRLVHADGTGVLNITNTPDFVSQYAWSPDGSKVAVVFLNYNGQGRTGLWVMNADGSSPLLVGSGSYPDWSPDGTKIAYRDLSGPGPGFDIVTITPSGGGLTHANLSLDNSDPRWSPDGRRMAFRRNSGQLLLMNVLGSMVRRATPAGPPSVAPGFHWSPDGKMLSIDGWLYDPRGKAPIQLPETCVNATWAPDAQHFVCYNGAELVSWTRLGAGKTGLGIAGTLPAFSNDGSKLAYIYGGAPATAQSIFVANANGTSPVLVSTGTENAHSPQWRP